MTGPAKQVQRTYLVLTLLSTLAASLIWGINTLFLLDAGLNNTEAFTANAFFTAGEMLFEIPTGVVADTYGRRVSYLLGSLTLLLSTTLYLFMWQLRAPLWCWAGASMLLGLGFTFFSGATEAWLVDALTWAGYEGKLDTVLARGQIVGGIAMLSGAVAGGYIAQWTDLGVPYIVRSALLGLTLVAAWLWMKDLGFTPERRRGALVEFRGVWLTSLEHGWHNAPVRWLMLAGLCSGGVGIFGFYAAQPFLLQLYGDPSAFGIAGLSAAIVAGAQIASGVVAPYLRKLFARRTSVLLFSGALSVLALWSLSVTTSFTAAVCVLAVWSFVFWIGMPMRQTYLNANIPSAKRATVLSFDNLLTSAGGVVAQPALGRLADRSGYPFSYLVSAVLQLSALPFLLFARRTNAPSDPIETDVPVEA